MSSLPLAERQQMPNTKKLWVLASCNLFLFVFRWRWRWCYFLCFLLIYFQKWEINRRTNNFSERPIAHKRYCVDTKWWLINPSEAILFIYHHGYDSDNLRIWLYCNRNETKKTSSFQKWATQHSPKLKCTTKTPAPTSTKFQKPWVGHSALRCTSLQTPQCLWKPTSSWATAAVRATAIAIATIT